MLSAYIEQAKAGAPLWLPQMREELLTSSACGRIILRLTACDGQATDFHHPLPAWQSNEERAFVVNYLCASVHNAISALGGRELRFFADTGDMRLVRLLGEVQASFAPGGAYAKCVQVATRICKAAGCPPFAFAVQDMREYSPAKQAEGTLGEALAPRLAAVTAQAQTGAYCGIDVGGTDIKLAASLNGRLVCIKEFDWNPAAGTVAEDITEPILLLTRLMRAYLAARGLAESDPLWESLERALEVGTSLKQIAAAAAHVEEALGPAVDILDGVGLSFPDVVIHERILGGETPKTKGIRENPAVHYEVELSKIGALREGLQALCRQDGRVCITNDGHMAAFVAAMEMAAGGSGELAGGVIAHTLGTDLGTGWLGEDGSIPQMPLELYDLLLDLGSLPARGLPAADLRSVRNENSGLPGARRYMGQAAAFRLAAALKPTLLNGCARQEGDLLLMPTEPEDMRKPCLERLMALAEAGDAAAAEIFRRIGTHLGWLSREMDFLLQPKTDTRFLFGRFIKRQSIFALLCAGCAETAPRIRLLAADEELAGTPLMKQLAKRQDATVAQFGQAVGSIYFSIL
ncbi:MAG: hypothetical protein VB051_02520 [Candidatus Pelethousia sp.]|nr:hypothetical protein [Candidatus Pelethousia sp.]